MYITLTIYIFTIFRRSGPLLVNVCPENRPYTSNIFRRSGPLLLRRAIRPGIFRCSDVEAGLAPSLLLIVLNSPGSGKNYNIRRSTPVRCGARAVRVFRCYGVSDGLAPSSTDGAPPAAPSDSFASPEKRASLRFSPRHLRTPCTAIACSGAIAAKTLARPRRSTGNHDRALSGSQHQAG